MIKTVFLFLLTIVFSSSTLADVGFLGMRAEAWKVTNSYEKSLYIQGVFDGLVFSNIEVHGIKLSTKINIEQYSKAIDELYSDYKNSLIPIPLLMRVVTLEIQGKEKDFIEKELQKYRLNFSK